MEKMHFSVIINEPREKVWHTILDDKTYREWTTVFNPPGSWYEGEWKEGSKILFVGVGEDGSANGGMVSLVKELRPYEFVSIQHVGILKDGVEDTTSEEVKKWAPAFENYTFNEMGNSTEVVVDQDIDPEYKAQFEEMWPKALQKLKEIAERA